MISCRIKGRVRKRKERGKGWIALQTMHMASHLFVSWEAQSQTHDLMAYCLWHSDNYSGVYNTDRTRVPGYPCFQDRLGIK